MFTGGLCIFDGAPRIKKLYTNGIENVAWQQGFTQRGYTYTEEAADLYIRSYWTTDFGICVGVTTNPLNLTQFKYLNVQWERASNNIHVLEIGVSLNRDTSEDFQAGYYYLSVSTLAGVQTTQVDISALNGNYYIKIYTYAGDSGVYNNTAIKVYKVWLSKY